MAKKKTTGIKNTRVLISLFALALLSFLALNTVQLLERRNNVTSEPAEAAANKCSTDFKVLGTCNNECASNSDCVSGLKCVSGSCRLASNPTSTTCSDVKKIGEFEWTSPTIYDPKVMTTQKSLDLMSGTKRVKITVTKLESSSENQLKDERSEWAFTFTSPTGSKKITCNKEQKTYECGNLTYDTSAASFGVLGRHLGATAGTTGSHEVKIKVEMFSF